MKKLDIGDPNATMIAGYFEDAFGVPPSQRTTRAVDGTYYHMGIPLAHFDKLVETGISFERPKFP